MKICLGCESAVEPILSFGRMPIANGFLLDEQFPDEYFFDLQVGFCPTCSLVQLTEVVDPTKMFHSTYAFFASTSASMSEHFRLFAEDSKIYFPNPYDPFVVEIGSNDGIMLKNFAQAGIRHLGVEPSSNVASEAITNGANTMCSFFSKEVANQIKEEHGLADAIMGANVFSHIPDVHSLFGGVSLLLKDDGVFILEEPYLGDIVDKTAYDQFYDEHIFYFCLTSLQNLLAQHGMTITDAIPQQTHGGSMRYVVSKKGSRQVSQRLSDLYEREASLGLNQISTYVALKDRIFASRTQLVNLLTSLKDDGKRVVGYGATSKSTTVTNYCGIGPDLIEFISDTTPTKQHKFNPGTHIPVRPYQEFQANYPDYALLFAWNYSQEIMTNEHKFLDHGGRFITFVPEVGIQDLPN